MSRFAIIQIFKFAKECLLRKNKLPCHKKNEANLDEILPKSIELLPSHFSYVMSTTSLIIDIKQ